MRFSGVAKVGVPKTQDTLHCGCIINIVAQPAVCPLTSLLLVPHWGEMEVVAWPSARHSQMKKQARLCWWSVFTDRNQRTQPHLERPVWWECRSKEQRGSWCICFKQRPKRLTTGSTFCLPSSAGPCIYSILLFLIQNYLISLQLPPRRKGYS